MNSFNILYGDFGTLPNIFKYSNVNIPIYLDKLNEIMNNFVDYYSNSWRSLTHYCKLLIKFREYFIAFLFCNLSLYSKILAIFFLPRNKIFSSIIKSRLEESPTSGHDSVVSEESINRVFVFCVLISYKTKHSLALALKSSHGQMVDIY